MSYGKLILLRHGQSTWHKSNQFTGWVDVDLTEQGEQEAANAGQLLVDKGILPDIVFTSLLRRAIRTANIALNAADRHWIPVERNWRLNERHYGKLQGLNKAEIREEFGEEQFMTWRRSYDTPPPELADDNEFSQANDPRYAFLPQGRAPSASRTSWSASCRSTRTLSCQRFCRARTSWSPLTATPCARWSSTWTTSRTRTSRA